MTRYRLPDALGGGEVDVLHGFARDDGRLDCDVVGVGVITVPARALVEVKPPLPDEPAHPTPGNLSYFVDRYGVAWHNSIHHDQWQSSGGRPNLSWGDLWLNAGPLTRLVPDPFAEPVELPWRRKFDDSSDLVVDRSKASNRAVYVDGLYGHITAEEARDMARALWTAADAAEKEQS